MKKYKIKRYTVTASDGYEEKKYVFFFKVPTNHNLREIVPITRKTIIESRKWTF